MRNFGVVLVLLVVYATGHSILLADFNTIIPNEFGTMWSIEFINNAGNFFLSSFSNLVNTFNYIIIEKDITKFLEMISLHYVENNSLIATMLDILIIIFNGIYIVNELVSVLLGAFTGWLRSFFKFFS